MARSPEIKVYDAEGEYRAAFKILEDAALFASWLGDGVTIRPGHSKLATLWTEGEEDFPAGESLDSAADVMRERVGFFASTGRLK